MVHQTRQAALVVFFMTAAVGWIATAAFADSKSDTTKTTSSEFLPRRQFEPLPGRITGILVSGGQDLLADEGRKGPPNAYSFSTRGESYRWMLVPVQKMPLIGGIRLPVGRDGKTFERFDKLNFATPESLKDADVSGPIALVEVQVNNGLGSPNGEKFVATKVRRIDGTPEFPLPLVETVAQLRRTFDEWQKTQAPEIENALFEAEKKSLNGQKPTGPKQQTDVLYVSWLPDEERIQVRFRSRWTNGAYEYAEKPKANLPAWALKIPNSFNRGANSQPEKSYVRYGTTFGVDVGVAYEVSKRGELVSTKILPVTSFERFQKPPSFVTEKTARKGERE